MLHNDKLEEIREKIQTTDIFPKAYHYLYPISPSVCVLACLSPSHVCTFFFFTFHTHTLTLFIVLNIDIDMCVSKNYTSLTCKIHSDRSFLSFWSGLNYYRDAAVLRGATRNACNKLRAPTFGSINKTLVDIR